MDNQNKKNSLLDRIENERIKRLLSVMTEFDESKRPTYNQLLAEYFTGNQKGIFSEQSPKRPLQQVQALTCAVHQNTKATHFCFRVSESRYVRR